jgi:uncharacterized protein YjbJ (UPF0337 family)
MMNTSTNKPNTESTVAAPSIPLAGDSVSAKPATTPAAAPPATSAAPLHTRNDTPATIAPTRQMEQGIPSGDEIAGKWKQKVGAAKVTWGKLTDDELLKLEGHEQKLAGLVQERYAISRDAAQKQVRTFFEQHMS